MTTLYKYACGNDHCVGTYTWVEWLANEHRPQTQPCCAECGSNEQVKWCNETTEVEDN